MKAKVAVLIPTLNEEATIGQVIDKIPVRVLSDEGYYTVTYVIDGDSEDATQQKALEKDAVVLRVKQPGKGSAMQFAFASVRADYFIMIDGDDTYPPQRITDFRTPSQHVRSRSWLTDKRAHRGGCQDPNQRVWQPGAYRRGSHAL